MTDIRRMIVHMSEMQQYVIPTWTLGWRLQRALDFADVKAGTMADELGVTRSTVSRWMHDSGTPPRDIYLRHWATRCGVPFEWLKEGDHHGTTAGCPGGNPFDIPVPRHHLLTEPVAA